MRWNAKGVRDVVEHKPLEYPAETVIEILSEHVTDARLDRFFDVASRRLRGVDVAIERLADPHNVSAILRSCDAFGVPALHYVTGRFGFRVTDKVARKTDRWISIHRHQSAKELVADRQKAGHSLWVASMEGDTSLEEIRNEDKITLVFGNEHAGPTDTLRELADGTFSIPMRGFVESLNVSVAAAISLFHVTQGRPPLKKSEQIDAVARYLLKSVPDGREILLRKTAEKKALGVDSL